MTVAKPDDKIQALLRRSLLEITRLKAKLADQKPTKAEPIAVVGMGCRFPGRGETLEGFWRDLEEGADTIRKVPAERWVPTEKSLPGTDWGGFLTQDLRLFDADLFGLSPAEARALDPQQRLLLEVSWEALEHGGIAPASLARSRTGVFVGVSTSDYKERVHALFDAQQGGLDTLSAAGAETCFAAGRVAFALGLEGPAAVIDGACAASLVAIDEACRALRTLDADLALACGVNAILSPRAATALAGSGLLSPDGRCRTFDARANGFVRSEGCGVIVLKRLADARRDGNVVLALLRGSAVNHNGRATALIAPSGRAQVALLRAALQNAGVTASAIDYVEAHGTGTPLGDPLELESIKTVLGAPREDGSKCFVGAVKTNLGHLEAAAGMAGVIKTVLALQHEVIPKTPVQALSRRLPRAEELGPITVAVEPVPWKRGPRARLAGVSSFGMNGTNAHVIVEEGDPRAEQAATEIGDRLLVLSARTPAGLRAQARSFAEHLARSPGASLGDACHTAAVGRNHFEHRFAAIAGGRAAMAEVLAQAAQGEDLPGGAVSGRAPEAPRRVAFVFPASEATDPAALFAAQCELTEQWRARGIAPDGVLGVGSGAWAAAVAAGAISKEAALALLADPREPVALPAHVAFASAQGARIEDARAWAVRLRDSDSPFERATAELLAADVSVFLEMGDGALVEKLDPALTRVASVRSDAALARSMLDAFAVLHVSGAKMDPGALGLACPGRLVALPTYPFQREHHWLDSPQRSET